MDVKSARWPTAVIALALCGCATTTSLDPVPASAHVQFEAAAAADPKFSVGVSGPAKLRAGNTGAAVGAAIGALIGASLCGSAFLICSPFLALAFAPIGATVALGFGNTDTLTPGLTQGLRRALETVGPTTRPHDDVVAGARAAQRWSAAGGDTPVTRVVVRIDEVQLRAVTEQRSHVALRGRVEVSREGRAPRWGRDFKDFEYVGPDTDVTPWLESPNAALAESLRQAYRLAGENLVAELTGAAVAAPARTPE
jgi:hypothetical protein